jgi:hypothetical protein
MVRFMTIHERKVKDGGGSITTGVGFVRLSVQSLDIHTCPARPKSNKQYGHYLCRLSPQSKRVREDALQACVRWIERH